MMAKFNWAMFNRPKVNKYYFIGLPKTGSSSFAGILEKYGAYHEFQFAETITKLYELKNDKISEQSFVSFLDKREKSMYSKFDSSTFNFHYVNYLKQNKNNKFIFPIRDMYSWGNSLLNHICFHFNDEKIEDWSDTLCKFFFGDWYRASDFLSSDSILQNIDDLIPKLCIYWANGMNKVLDNMPDNTLVLNTKTRSENITLIADFVGLTESDFNLGGWGLNEARHYIDYFSFNTSMYKVCEKEYLPDIILKMREIGIDNLETFSSFNLKIKS